MSPDLDHGSNMCGYLAITAIVELAGNASYSSCVTCLSHRGNTTKLHTAVDGISYIPLRMLLILRIPRLAILF